MHSKDHYIILFLNDFRFFKAVNSKEGKLRVKRRSFLLNDADLIGLDYLWRVSVFFSRNEKR